MPTAGPFGGWPRRAGDPASVRAVAGVLAEGRRREVRHGAGAQPAWATGLLVATLAMAVAGTVVVAALRYARPGAGADVLAFVLGLWCIAWVAQSATGGGTGVLAPEVFRALPLPVRPLALAVLVVRLADPGLWCAAGTFAAALVVLAVRDGGGAPAVAGAVVVAVVTGVLLAVAVGVAATVAGGSLGPGSRRGRDGATVVAALAIAVAGAAGAAGPLVAAALAGDHAPAFQAVVRWLPSGWAPDAVRAAGEGRLWPVVGAVVGLAAAAVLSSLVWPPLLARRMGERKPLVLQVRAGRRRLLPAGPVGAVAAKELRLWTRVQLRVIFVVVAVLFGVWPCVVSRLEHGSWLLPFGGGITLVLAAACSVNLYGGDGPSFWCVASTPGSATADVKGRQLGWLLLFGPYAVVLSVVLTAVSGQGWAWPWVLSGLPALLGGGAGMVVLGSLVGVLPLAADGGPTPAWSAKIHAAIVVAVLPLLPAVAVAGLGTAWHVDGLRWAAVPVGVATGLALGLGLGRAAARRLARDQVDILARVAADA